MEKQTSLKQVKQKILIISDFWGGCFLALKGRQHTSPGQRPGLNITMIWLVCCSPFRAKKQPPQNSI